MSQSISDLFTVEPGVKTVLNVGCGSKGPSGGRPIDPQFQGDGWREIRLDIEPAVEPDIVASVTDMGVVPDQRADALWSSHNVEHLFYHEVGLALKEFFRVIKPGGVAVVCTPNMQMVAEQVTRGELEKPLYHSPAGPICPIDVLWGHRAHIAAGHHHMAHKTGFTPQTLGAHLLRAGFKPIRLSKRGFEIVATAQRPG